MVVEIQAAEVDLGAKVAKVFDEKPSICFLSSSFNTTQHSAQRIQVHKLLHIFSSYVCTLLHLNSPKAEKVVADQRFFGPPSNSGRMPGGGVSRTSAHANLGFYR